MQSQQAQRNYPYSLSFVLGKLFNTILYKLSFKLGKLFNTTLQKQPKEKLEQNKMLLTLIWISEELQPFC